MDVKANTEIRELSVCLAIADMASGNGYYRLGELQETDLSEEDYGFDVPYTESSYVGSDGQEYNLKTIDYDTTVGWTDNGYDQCNELNPSVFTDGKVFCDTLRSYGIDIDTYGGVDCENMDWVAPMPKIARDNYALGIMIAEYFGIGPGAVEKIIWYGPENSKGDKRQQTPPADIGVKLVGTPQRQVDIAYTESMRMLPQENSDDESWKVFVKALADNNYYDADCDIAISLKDGSDILGTLGFAGFASRLLQCEYKNGTDFFAEYAYDDYENWFQIAWNMMLDWLYDHDYSFSKTGKTGAEYSIWIESDDEVTFQKVHNGKTQTITMPFETTLFDWKGNRCGQARQAFSKWCTTYGNKTTEYIQAQVNCSRNSSIAFSHLLQTGAINEKFYDLVGWRMSEYYYAKIERQGRSGQMVLCGVPSVYNAGQYELDVQVSDNPIMSEEIEQPDESAPLVTQAIVPFTLDNSELGLHASFQLVIRFTDGMFNSPPQVTVKTLGEYPGTYYVLDEHPVSDYLPEV